MFNLIPLKRWLVFPVRKENRNMDELYETQITHLRWIAYDIPGNVGWIMYIAACALSFKKQPVFLDVPLVLICMVISIIPAIAMVIGIVELLNERYYKLSRLLTKRRLYRGFGALTWGGFGGIIVSLTALFTSIRYGYSLNECKYIVLMLLGGILCFIFAGLIFTGFRRKTGD